MVFRVHQLWVKRCRACLQLFIVARVMECLEPQTSPWSPQKWLQVAASHSSFKELEAPRWKTRAGRKSAWQRWKLRISKIIWKLRWKKSVLAWSKKVHEYLWWSRKRRMISLKSTKIQPREAARALCNQEEIVSLVLIIRGLHLDLICRREIRKLSIQMSSKKIKRDF